MYMLLDPLQVYMENIRSSRFQKSVILASERSGLPRCVEGLVTNGPRHDITNLIAKEIKLRFLHIIIAHILNC
jgi:hypothetical protein